MDRILVIGLSGESVFLSCDHFNHIGETIKADTKFIEPGGKGYNQALALGKIGSDISFITALGNDDYVKTCLNILKDNNVKVYPIYKDVASSYANIITNKDGENNVIVYDGASSMITYEDIMMYKEVIDECDILLLQLEYPYEVIVKIIDYAYQIHKKIILNPAPFKVIDSDVLSKLFLITPNEFELLHMTNCNNIDEAFNCLKINNIICTCGEKEIVVKENRKRYKIPVKRVKAIDTTGAGDIFNAFVTRYINEFSLKQVSEIASIASTISVQRKGVVMAIPTINEVMNEWRNKNGY